VGYRGRCWWHMFASYIRMQLHPLWFIGSSLCSLSGKPSVFHGCFADCFVNVENRWKARLPIIEVLDWYLCVKYIEKRTVKCQPCILCRALTDGTSCRTTSSTLVTFKKRLKTHIFHCIMWNVLVTECLCISYHSVFREWRILCRVGR